MEPEGSTCPALQHEGWRWPLLLGCNCASQGKFGDAANYRTIVLLIWCSWLSSCFSMKALYMFVVRRSRLLTRSSLADKKSVNEARLKEKAETPAPKERKLIQAPDFTPEPKPVLDARGSATGQVVEYLTTSAGLKNGVEVSFRHCMERVHATVVELLCQWHPTVPCSWFGCWLLRLVLAHSGFNGDWLLCNLLRVLFAGIYFTAVGFHPGGHSCIADQVFGNAVSSCSTCIQAGLQAWTIAWIILPIVVCSARKGYDVLVSKI